MIPPGLLPAAWRFATSRMGLGLIAALALGLLWLRGDHYRSDRDKALAKVAQLEAASVVNARLAWEQKARVEALSRNQAKDAQNAFEQARADTRARVAGYTDRMRLNKVCGSNPAPAASGDDPGVPVDLPADSDLVAIRETDLQALVDWLAIGVEARNNAVDKVNAGLAIPAVEFGLDHP